MEPPTPTPDTRTRILTEAERLFRHYGYGKTTIADISEACGMSPANVYRFFPSKSALTEAICGRIIAQLEGKMFEIVRRPIPASERLASLIAEIHRHALEDLLDRHKVHEMVVVAIEEQWVTVRNHIDRMTAYIGEIIRDGVASGEFANADVQRAAKTVHTAIVCFCHPAMVAQKLQDEERVTPEEMASFLIEALKRR